MAVDDNVGLYELGAFFSDGLMAAQLGLFMVSLLVFAASLALCLMATRAASQIRRSNVEARDIAAFVERQSHDLREMGEEVERARQDVLERQSAFERAQQEFMASLPAPVTAEPAEPTEPVEETAELQTAVFATGEAPEPAPQPELEPETAKTGSFFRMMRRR